MQKLKNLEKPLKKMIQKNDTLVGMKFSFRKHAKYNTYIAAQDLLFMNKAHYYIMYKYDIYVLEIPKKTPKVKQFFSVLPFICGYSEADERYWAEQAKKKGQELFIKNIKRFWQIPMALLGIIWLNLYMLIKFNKDRIYNQKSYI